MVAQRSVFGVFGCFERLFSNALFGRSTTSEARMIFLQAELGLLQELRRSCSIRYSSSTVACEDFLEWWPKGQCLVSSVASNDCFRMRCLGALLHLRQG